MEDLPGARPPAPVDVVDLFPELQGHLLSLLARLTHDEWDLPTVCPGWSVRDVALHLLGVDLGNLSVRRDRFRDPWWGTASGDTVRDLNVFNQNWVVAARRISPRLLRELLTVTGEAVSRYYADVDLSATGISVWWVGPDPAPVWLDIAREYTERWVHQQQIRDAVGQPGLKEARYLAPVIATFVQALPRALRAVSAPEGTVVRLAVVGEAGGRWIALRGPDRWALLQDGGEAASATVTIDQDLAWRLWTRGVSPEDARPRVVTTGHPELAARALEMVSIIA
ncbi:MAG: maleylpyruvate isomerase N-terminal domain-containing protein [Chloroflexi bacterium]|nr:maleylpyruvate isomerase N-terminal domain-containing protein [Chloroflexota bacterium]